MGKFTTQNYEFIDLCIQQQLNIIVEVIVEKLENNLKSIILFGGFARGEGSVKHISENRILPLKDYDILIIVDKKPTQKTVDLIYSMIYANLGMNDPKMNEFRFSDFVLDFTFTTLRNLQLYPDIALYEIKVASKLLYGEDIREKIPWEIEQIPLASGWRLLFEKMSGLIGHFPQNGLDNFKFDKKKRELLIYECNKTYVEIATALCLLMGCYVPSFVGRKRKFVENYEKLLPDLFQILPDLPNQVSKATDFKLNPKFKNFNENPLDFWFSTRDTLIIVSNFYLSNFLDLECENVFKNPNLIKKKLSQNYSRHMASGLNKNILKTQNSYLTILSNHLLNLYFNIKYFLDFHKQKNVYPINLIIHPFTLITAGIHSIAPQILLSIRRNGTLNLKHFKMSAYELNKFKAFNKLETFNDLCKAYLFLYKMISLH